MKPTSGNLFVEKSDSKQTIKKFDIINSHNARYRVTQVADDVARCKVGDFVLFTDYKTYQFDGKDIFVVKDDDIVAVDSETKK